MRLCGNSRVRWCGLVFIIVFCIHLTSRPWTPYVDKDDPELLILLPSPPSTRITDTMPSHSCKQKYIDWIISFPFSQCFWSSGGGWVKAPWCPVSRGHRGNGLVPLGFSSHVKNAKAYFKHQLVQVSCREEGLSCHWLIGTLFQGGLIPAASSAASILNVHPTGRMDIRLVSQRDIDTGFT